MREVYIPIRSFYECTCPLSCLSFTIFEAVYIYDWCFGKQSCFFLLAKSI